MNAGDDGAEDAEPNATRSAEAFKSSELIAFVYTYHLVALK